MRTVRTAFAAILTALAFVAFESGADAQARRGESRSTTGTSSTTSRSRNVTVTKPSTSKPSGTVTRQTGTPARPSGTARPAGKTEKKQPASRPSLNTSNDRKPSTTVSRPANQNRPSGQVKPATQTRPSTTRPASPTRPVATRPSNQTRPSGNVTPPAKPGGNDLYKSPDRDKPISVTRPGTRPDRPANNTSAGKPSVRPDAGHAGKPDKPVQVRPDRKPEPPRVHPHDRDFIVYDRPSHFWTGHNHCYGHRVRILPSHVRRYIYHGITYYCYNDIWYRPFGGYYVVCRPPRGTVLAANLIADMTWAAVRLSYYYTVANTYSQINENNAYIAQQNAVIAQNNATIAAQNQTIAMNQQLASQAYGLANELGLVQSYAAAGSAYYYQDGVFYSMDSDGEYKVILPPAGALVETLPEDYEMVTLGGDEYYKVDDTVYRVTVSEGKPYFEVLGQLYA